MREISHLLLNRVALRPTTPSKPAAPPCVPAPDHHQSVSFILFFGFPWDHTAARVGSVFHSVHPHNLGDPTSDFDEDDLPNRLKQLLNNIIRPMTYSKMELPEEKNFEQFPCVEVKVPVTPAQFKKAQEVMGQQRTEATSGKLHYSIFNSLGMSCAKSTQTILQAITEGTPEEALAKPSSFELFFNWPTSTHERAKSIADARQEKTKLPVGSPIKI